MLGEGGRCENYFFRRRAPAEGEGVEALPEPSEEAAYLYSLISNVSGVINPNGFGDVDLSAMSAGSEDQSAIDALFD